MKFNLKSPKKKLLMCVPNLKNPVLSFGIKFIVGLVKNIAQKEILILIDLNPTTKNNL